jgi:hypothetical protein
VSKRLVAFYIAIFVAAVLVGYVVTQFFAVPGAGNVTSR